MWGDELNEAMDMEDMTEEERAEFEAELERAQLLEEAEVAGGDGVVMALGEGQEWDES